MSNDKNDRKKQGKILATIIILALATVLGINAKDLITNETSPKEDSKPYVQEESKPKEDSKPDVQEESKPKEESKQNAEEREKPTKTMQTVDGTLELTMIDVGQADSFFFEQGDSTALIDCGTRSTGKDVVQYLKDQGITKIDYVFGTHPHDDHMGGMYDVITNFEVGTIVLPDVTDTITTNWYLKLMNEISTGNYTTEYAEVGTIYNIGDATFEIIGPINAPTGNLNNYSTVIKVSFGEMDVIMTGDAEKDVEADILRTGIDLNAEILKVGHHGSDTSTSTAFLDAINPQYALISAKVGNKYNHPTAETMQSLEDRNIEVYRTDECGTVVATITTDSVTFSTSPGDYLSGPELEERSKQ